MRLAVLSFLFIVILNSESKAIDINSLDIENVKVGDNIYDHFDKRHVSANLKKIRQTYTSKRYTRNSFKVLSPKNYTQIGVHYNNDKIIGAVNGTILYRTNSKACAKKEKDILNDILASFSKKPKTKGRPGDKIRHVKHRDSY